jgi:uncharacterized protein YaaN involved in tellurite resistance
MAKALFGDESIQAAPAPAPVSFAPIQQSTSMVPSNTALTAQTVQIVDISRMSAADQTAAQNIARNINLEDTNAIVQFGMGAQVKIGGFADTVLNQVRNKNSGYVGEVMGGLMNHIKSVDVGGLNANAGPLSKIFGGLKARFVGFMNRYEKLSTQIDITVKELEKARTNLMQDIQMLDNLFKQNVQYLGELDVFIAAGQMKLEQARTEILPQLMATAERTNDPLDAQKLQDFNQMLVRFEKKLYDMKLSRMISIQTGPQLRLIQSNNQTLVEKIQSSVVNTIPLWNHHCYFLVPPKGCPGTSEESHGYDQRSSDEEQ